MNISVQSSDGTNGGDAHVLSNTPVSKALI